MPDGRPPWCCRQAPPTAAAPCPLLLAWHAPGRATPGRLCTGCHAAAALQRSIAPAYAATDLFGNPCIYATTRPYSLQTVHRSNVPEQRHSTVLTLRSARSSAALLRHAIIASVSSLSCSRDDAAWRMRRCRARTGATSAQRAKQAASWQWRQRAMTRAVRECRRPLTAARSAQPSRAARSILRLTPCARTTDLDHLLFHVLLAGSALSLS